MPNSGEKKDSRAWWSPSTITMAPPPEAWATYLVLEDLDESKAMKSVGYDLAASPRYDDDDIYCLFVWKHDDGHLFVEMRDFLDREMMLFFVQPHHAPAFFMEKLPVLLKMINDSAISMQLRRIATTLTAFVRHGEGEMTIDESGLVSRDEYLRRREKREVRRREKREAEAAS